MSTHLEICCTSLASAEIAQEAGASRIELCDNILEGGTTPSAGLIARVLEAVDIPVNVLVRPRGGDFCYSQDEFNIIQLDIAACLEMGVDGIVCGVLKKNRTIDHERTLRLLEMCRGIDFTFHRAFDLVPDLFEALETLDDLGVNRILTSGGENSVADGAASIAALINKNPDLTIMAGGGLTTANIDLVLKTGCRDLHTTAKEWRTTMAAAKVKMNAMTEIPENRYMQASNKEIKALLAKIEAFHGS